MDPAFVSSNLDLATIEEFLETLGLLIPPAVLVALAGILVDAFRGSRPIPPFWGLVARVVLDGAVRMVLPPAGIEEPSSPGIGAAEQADR